MIHLQCQCCQIREDFATAADAFNAGWDAPPNFTTHVACPLCPAVCIVLELSHAKAHAYWEQHGRPADFNRYCLPDKQWAGDAA